MDLSQARLYLVAPARIASGELAAAIAELAAAGVDVVQLREKEMEAADLLRVGEPIAAACRAAGIPFIVNDRADVALALGADGVHLGQNDLPIETARRILPSAIVGRSTHTFEEAERAATEEAIDYFAAGPVYATPTKAGRPAAGLGLIRQIASSSRSWGRAAPSLGLRERGEEGLPWFAIGGIEAANLDEVLEAGARRIVVVRAITQAQDPAAAAHQLKERLLAVALEAHD